VVRKNSLFEKSLFLVKALQNSKSIRFKVSLDVDEMWMETCYMQNKN